MNIGDVQFCSVCGEVAARKKLGEHSCKKCGEYGSLVPVRIMAMHTNFEDAIRRYGDMVSEQNIHQDYHVRHHYFFHNLLLKHAPARSAAA